MTALGSPRRRWPTAFPHALRPFKLAQNISAAVKFWTGAIVPGEGESTADTRGVTGIAELDPEPALANCSMASGSPHSRGPALSLI